MATVADDSGDGRAASLAIGPTLGRYTIERRLGIGGMGIVYAAFDPELERSVALKVLRSGMAADAEQRLLREARAMARLAHPNVVTVYEVGSVDGRDYIAMELVDGENLVDWKRTQKPDERVVLQAFVAAGRGLATAHEASIVHRDFKPHNVLRSRRGRVMVTDFGLARETANAVATQEPSTSSQSTLDDPGIAARHARVHGSRAMDRRRGHAGDGSVRVLRRAVGRACRAAAVHRRD